MQRTNNVNKKVRKGRGDGGHQQPSASGMNSNSEVDKRNHELKRGSANINPQYINSNGPRNGSQNKLYKEQSGKQGSYNNINDNMMYNNSRSYDGGPQHKGGEGAMMMQRFSDQHRVHDRYNEELHQHPEDRFRNASGGESRAPLYNNNKRSLVYGNNSSEDHYVGIPAQQYHAHDQHYSTSNMENKNHHHGKNIKNHPSSYGKSTGGKDPYFFDNMNGGNSTRAPTTRSDHEQHHFYDSMKGSSSYMMSDVVTPPHYKHDSYNDDGRSKGTSTFQHFESFSLLSPKSDHGKKEGFWDSDHGKKEGFWDSEEPGENNKKPDGEMDFWNTDVGDHHTYQHNKEGADDRYDHDRHDQYMNTQHDNSYNTERSGRGGAKSHTATTDYSSFLGGRNGGISPVSGRYKHSSQGGTSPYQGVVEGAVSIMPDESFRPPIKKSEYNDFRDERREDPGDTRPPSTVRPPPGLRSTQFNDYVTEREHQRSLSDSRDDDSVVKVSRPRNAQLSVQRLEYFGKAEGGGSLTTTATNNAGTTTTTTKKVLSVSHNDSGGHSASIRPADDHYSATSSSSYNHAPRFGSNLHEASSHNDHMMDNRNIKGDHVKGTGGAATRSMQVASDSMSIMGKIENRNHDNYQNQNRNHDNYQYDSSYHSDNYNQIMQNRSFHESSNYYNHADQQHAYNNHSNPRGDYNNHNYNLSRQASNRNMMSSARNITENRVHYGEPRNSNSTTSASYNNNNMSTKGGKGSKSNSKNSNGKNGKGNNGNINMRNNNKGRGYNHGEGEDINSNAMLHVANLHVANLHNSNLHVANGSATVMPRLSANNYNSNSNNNNNSNSVNGGGRSAGDQEYPNTIGYHDEEGGAMPSDIVSSSAAEQGDYPVRLVVHNFLKLLNVSDCPGLMKMFRLCKIIESSAEGEDVVLHEVPPQYPDHFFVMLLCPRSQKPSVEGGINKNGGSQHHSHAFLTVLPGMSIGSAQHLLDELRLSWNLCKRTGGSVENLLRAHKVFYFESLSCATAVVKWVLKSYRSDGGWLRVLESKSNASSVTTSRKKFNNDRVEEEEDGDFATPTLELLKDPGLIPRLEALRKEKMKHFPVGTTNYANINSEVQFIDTQIALANTVQNLHTEGYYGEDQDANGEGGDDDEEGGNNRNNKRHNKKGHNRRHNKESSLREVTLAMNGSVVVACDLEPDKAFVPPPKSSIYMLRSRMKWKFHSLIPHVNDQYKLTLSWWRGNSIILERSQRGFDVASPKDVYDSWKYDEEGELPPRNDDGLTQHDELAIAQVLSGVSEMPLSDGFTLEKFMCNAAPTSEICAEMSEPVPIFFRRNYEYIHLMGLSPGDAISFYMQGVNVAFGRRHNVQYAQADQHQDREQCARFVQKSFHDFVRMTGDLYELEYVGQSGKAEKILCSTLQDKKPASLVAWMQQCDDSLTQIMNHRTVLFRAEMMLTNGFLKKDGEEWKDQYIPLIQLGHCIPIFFDKYKRELSQLWTPSQSVVTSANVNVTQIMYADGKDARLQAAFQSITKKAACNREMIEPLEDPPLTRASSGEQEVCSGVSTSPRNALSENAGRRPTPQADFAGQSVWANKFRELRDLAKLESKQFSLDEMGQHQLYGKVEQHDEHGGITHLPFVPHTEYKN